MARRKAAAPAIAAAMNEGQDASFGNERVQASETESPKIQRAHGVETAKAVLVRVSEIVVAPNRMRALRPEKVAEIAESIQAREGLLQPIVLRPRGRNSFWLVAGRHRLEAARELGLDSILAIIRDGLDADAAQLDEIDENLVRAELSPAERALHVGKRKDLYEKLHPETKHGGDRKSAEAKSRSQNENLKAFVADAAKKTGKGRSTVAREVTRANKVVVLPEIVGTSLDQGDELDALGGLPEAEQHWLAKRAKAGERVTARHAMKLLRRKEREHELAAATEAASKALGKKLYGVIYADPPWRYNNPPMGDVARANENHYPTMELAEISALKLPAAEHCVLFLWAPFPILAQAVEVVRAWGFKQTSGSAWRKGKKGTGYWVLSEVELLLICTRGNVPAPAPGEQFPGFIEAPRGRHSGKARHLRRKHRAAVSEYPQVRNVRAQEAQWLGFVGK
jgi:ParB-like chromosome segregation protein Spo0J